MSAQEIAYKAQRANFMIAGNCLFTQSNPTKGLVFCDNIAPFLKDAMVSVCGKKGHVFRQRLIPDFGESDTIIDSATSLAFMDIDNSPIHYHEQTSELYYIWEGSGQFFLDNKIVNVTEGHYVLIQPGVTHGLYSLKGVKAVLFFMPGLVNTDSTEGILEYRDETILESNAYDRIKSVAGQIQKNATPRRSSSYKIGRNFGCTACTKKEEIYILSILRPDISVALRKIFSMQELSNRKSSMHLVLEGSGICQSEGEEYCLQKGSAFFLPPQTPCATHSSENKLTVLSCYFDAPYKNE